MTPNNGLKMQQDTKLKEIDEMIERFNFEFVHHTMSRLGWYWKIDDKLVIPSIDQLKEKARELLETMDKDNVDNAISGGFEASVFKGRKYLKFTLESVPWV